MAKVRPGKILATFAALLIAIQSGVIWRLLSRDKQPQSSAGEFVGREELRAKNEKLQAENTRLRSELEKTIPLVGAQHAASQRTTEAGAGAAVGRLAVLMEAKKIGAVAHIPAADRTRKLDSKFIRLFELSTSEQEDLQQAMDTAMRTSDQLESESATIQTNPDGTVIISVKSYAEKGGVIYDQLLNAFAKTLGPERYEAFTALSAESMERDLGGFGTREKQVTIQWNAEAKRYDVREQYRSFQNSGTSTSHLPRFSEVEKRYPGIAPLIPAQLRDKVGVSSK